MYTKINAVVNSVGSACTYGEVRLVGGNDKYEGRVEVCIENGWHTVCDNGWGVQEAVVVCGQLGYSYTGGKYYIIYVSIIHAKHSHSYSLQSRQMVIVIIPTVCMCIYARFLFYW